MSCIPTPPFSKGLFLCALFSFSSSHLNAQANVDETASALNPIYVDAANVSGTENGSAAHPWNTIAEGFAQANSSGSQDRKVLIADGTYRNESLSLSRRAGATVVEGESRGGVIITGANVWSGWMPDGDNWYKAWTYDWGLGNISYTKKPESDLGRRSEMVIQDGMLLRQVMSLGEMADGCYFVDETADRLYVRPAFGLPPTDVTLEVAELRKIFFMYAADNVVLRNLTFRHTAGGATSGVSTRVFFIGGAEDLGGSLEDPDYKDQPINRPPDRDFAENILIEDCIFEWNNGGGASINNAKYITIRNCEFNYNGSAGLGATRLQYSEYVDSEFNYNNWRKGLLGGLYGWAPAGTKTLFADQFTIRGCDFIGNHTAGLWMDFGSTNVTVFDSLMTHNWSQGFYNEANYGPVNASALLVRNNGFWPLDGDEPGGGIFYAESRAFSVSNSYIINNSYYGLGYRNSSRLSTAYWSGSTYETVDTWAGISKEMNFFQNTVVAGRTETQSGWDTDTRKNGTAIGLHSDGTTGWGTESVPTYSGDYNTYYSPHTTEIFTDKEDDSYGFDKVDLACWQLDTEHEQNSTWDANWQVGLDFDAYQESGGLVVFEAENYFDNQPGSDDAPWQINHGFWTNDLGHLGSGYLEPPVNAVVGDSGSAKLSYRINIQNAGTYHLAVRRIAKTTTDDSVHVIIDGNPVGDSATLLAGDVGVWTWKHANVSLGFLDAGVHTLELVRREDGFQIDRIAIADDVAKLPADGSTVLGSEESPIGRPSQNDVPVTVTPLQSVVREIDPGATFRFSRSGIDGDLEISFALGGSALAGVDYVAPATTVQIPDGSSYADVFVAFLEDGVAEESKTVSIAVSSNPNYTVGVPGSAIVTQPANGLLGLEDVQIVQPTGTTQTFALEIHNPFNETVTYTLEDPDELLDEHIWVPEPYSWSSIASGGNAIAALDDDDSDYTDSSMRVDFSKGYFQFYGVNDFDRCVVSSNGLINFVFSGGNYNRRLPGLNIPLPSLDVWGPAVAGYWDDLKTVTSENSASRIYETTSGDRQIFQFEQLENREGDEVTFQIVLDYNGNSPDDDEVVVYFKEVPDGNESHTIGAQGNARRAAGGTRFTGALYAYNEDRVTDLSALRLVPMPEWFSSSVSESSISVPPGETATIEFTIDTNGLPNGTTLSRIYTLVPDREDIENSPLSVDLLVDDGVGGLSLEDANLTVQEDDGSVTLSVTRSAGTLGAVSIDYATADISALAGSNYTARSGTLSWGDGESGTKSVVVPLINDPSIEPTKQFAFVLSNPQGGILPPGPLQAIISVEESAPNTAPSITVNSPVGVPTVEDLATALFLNIDVADDTIPQPSAYTWEQVSGPGTASFDDAAVASTSVAFDTEGLYVLRLTADDSALTDSVEITVQAGIPDLVPPTDGLGFYYPMDASSGTIATDVSPKSNFGKLLSESAGDGWASGYKNNGYLFADGSYTRFTSNSRVNISESEGVTFAAWIRWDQGGSERYIAVHGNAGTGTRREWLSVTSDGRLKSKLGGGTTQTSTGKITIGQWHHVAVTGGNGRIKLYIDGVKEADRGDSVETGGASLQISNARLGFGAASVWRGMIDEVYCYNDTLTAYEIGILHGSSVYEENLAPEPTVGAPQSIVASGSLTLSGSASDDGQPSPPASISYQWQQVSGPGTALFVDATDPNTSVSLPAKGDYRFRLVADDGESASSAYVTHRATGSPADLAVAELNGTSAELTWTDSLGETGYRVWMRVTGASEWTFVSDSIAADLETFTVTGLTRGLSYEFLVEAMDGGTPREGSEVTLVVDEGFVQESSGPQLLVIEAEDYTYIGNNGSNDDWTLTTAFSGYNGSGAMQAGPDDGNNYVLNVPNTAPYLAYDIDFETAGTHYVWMNCREPDNGNSGDSLHFGLNNVLEAGGAIVEQRYPDDYSVTGSYFSWVWKVRGGNRITIDVPTPGTHRIYVWPREDGIIVDQIILTTDETYVPTGSETISVGKPAGDYSAKEFWRMANWGISDDSGNAADLANPELDIFSNLQEFAFGADPMSIDGPELLPFERIAEDTGKHYLEYRFRRRVGVASGSTESGYSVDGVTYKVEVSHDMSLGSWQTGSSYLEQVGAPIYNEDGTETVTVRIIEDAETAPKRFIRLKVE